MVACLEMTNMAVVYKYTVSKTDGSEKKEFKSKIKAEDYALSIKSSPEDHIMIVREGQGAICDKFTYYI